MTKREVRLEGGAPWGFRMNGGADSGHPLRISRVNPGSKAAQQGVREGDVISAINGTATRLLTNGDSHALLKSAGSSLTLGLNQDNTSSPKRRSRDLNKRENSAGSSQELNRLNDDHVIESQKSAVSASISTSSSDPATISPSQSKKQGKKPKPSRSHVEEEPKEKYAEKSESGDDDAQTEGKDENSDIQSVENGKKMSSSKARRLRKSRAKRKIITSDHLEISIIENCGSNDIDRPIDVENNNLVNDSSCDVAVRNENTITDDKCITLSSNGKRNADKKYASLPPIEALPKSDIATDNNSTNYYESNSSNLVNKCVNDETQTLPDKSEIMKKKSTKKSKPCPLNLENVECSSSALKDNRVEIDSDSIENKIENSPDSGIYLVSTEPSRFETKENENSEVLTQNKTSNEEETNKFLMLNNESSHSVITSDTGLEITQTSHVLPLVSSIIKKKKKKKPKNSKSVILETSEQRSSDAPGATIQNVNEVVTDVDRRSNVEETSLSSSLSGCKVNKVDQSENYVSLKQEIASCMGTTVRCEDEILVKALSQNDNTSSKLNCTEGDRIFGSYENNDGDECLDNTTKMTVVEFSGDISDPNNSSSMNDSKFLHIESSTSSVFNEEVDTDCLKMLSLLRDEVRSPVELVLNPPTPTLANEETFFGPDWEIAEEMKSTDLITSKSAGKSNAYKELSIHDSPNSDLRAEVNSLIIVEDCSDDLGLTVDDIRTPIIPPDEEKKLRSFLETLDLVKPDIEDEDYYAHNEDAKEEIVVYRHCTRRSSAEACYIPPPHRHYLDVITEENSDLSDTDRKSDCDKPWENPQLIKKNNDIDEIPDDWGDSDQEVEYPSEEDGGIKPWNGGTTLEDAEGIEIVYLDSDNSDETVIIEDHSEKNEPKLVVCKTGEMSKRQKINSTSISNAGVFNTIKITSKENHDGKNNTDENAVSRVIVKEKELQIDKKTQIDLIKAIPKSSELVLSCNNKLNHSKINACENFFLNNENLNKVSVNNSTLPPVSNADSKISDDQSAYDFEKESVEIQSISQNTNPMECKSEGSRNFKNNLETLDLIKVCAKSDGEVRSDSENIYEFIEFRQEKDCGSIIKGGIKEIDEGDKNNDDLIIPRPQVTVDVTATPILSRQNSSSSGTMTTQSTSKYNQSPTAWSSENEENPIVKDVSNMSFVEKNPESLRELSTKKVISLPNGLKLLEDIGIIQFRSVGYFPGANKDQSDFFNFQNNISGMPLTEFDFPDIACPPSRPMSVSGSCYPNRHSFSAKSCSILYTPPRSLVNSPPCSLPPDRERWIGIPTASQNTFVCFSPSQSSYARKSTLPPRPQEAAGLLDLHKKFIERRGYHEDRWRDSLSDLQSPDLIRLEQYNAPTKQRDYTPELLAEAANLLALKEYRESRCKESKSPDVEECEEDSVLKRFKIAKSKDFIKMGGGESSTFPSYNLRYGSEKCFNKDVETLNDLLKELEIDRRFGDDGNKATNCFVTASRQDTNENAEWSKGVVRNKIAKLENASIGFDEKGMSLGEVDTEQSDGSRLLALIQSQKDRPAKLQPIEAPSCNSRACSEDDDRSSGGVMTRGDRDSSRVFDADDYKISKRGDIAVMAGDGRERIKRPERPKSLPPGSSGSGTELFRQKMYEEYMEQVAERYERRQQKVIRLSRPASLLVDDTKDSASNEALNLEDEFMVKVRERMSKLGINLNEDQNDDNNNNEKDEDVDGCLPKHLQEFAQLAQVSSADPDGVWSPAQTPEAQRKAFDFSSAEKEQREDEERDKSSGSPPPVVWSPKSVPSPTAERKSYRPVKFESPPPIRKNIQRSKEDSPKPPTSLPLTTPDWSKQTTKSSTTYQSETTDVQQRLTSSQSADSSLAFSSEINLPRAPNPTITLLQKAREGQLPRGAHYLEGEEETASIASDDRRPHIVPNEIIYTVKKEYCSEGEDKKPKKIVELGPRKFEGIGPTTKEGIPIVLRSEVKDTNQQKWYKRMYDSLHKAEADNQYPYASAGGYLSEPDRLGYDSDLTSSKYATLDRRRIRNKEKDFTTSTMPRSKYVPDNSVKKPVDVYKNQPGRIEDYEPGRSSISEKEAKQWWDEVLDIFDEQFEQAQNTSRPPATTPNTGKPFMTYALKESGYESDSTLVFKRRDENLQNQLAMSPAEQKMAYKAIQKGGEVPLHGLRKPAPERPKEPIIGGAVPVPERSHLSKRQSESPHRYVESEVTIHYKSPVRAEAKEALSEEELAQRQAETMRRIYQEERRRKYLQELQDMYSRRHTDNFIPSQKSPIPLNRYDDFPNDVGSTLKSRDRTPEPKLVARALYNFVGQSSRELTFRRGDIIYVRRQIDKNWFEGEHNAMIGLFPLNHVEIIPYDGIRTMPKRSSEGQARAKFNFQAQTHLELSLVKGELVVLTRRVDENWFEGRIGSRKGIFPVSYVEVLVEPGERAVSPVRPTTPASNKPVASPASHSMILNGARNALSHHHYTPPPPVSYTSLSRPTKTSKQDLAPVNQALHIDTQSEPVPYRALYNYKPQNDDELELNEGDVVYVMEKCDDGWYVGSSQRTACFGTFPGNYVQRLPRGAGLSAYEDSILQQKDSHRVCY